MTTPHDKLRALVLAATPSGDYGPYTNRHTQVSVPLEELNALLDELDRLYADEATMKLARMLGLGEPVRPDIHRAVVRQRDGLTEQLAAVQGARDELANLAEHWAQRAAVHNQGDVKPARDASDRISSLRKVGTHE